MVGPAPTRSRFREVEDAGSSTCTSFVVQLLTPHHFLWEWWISVDLLRSYGHVLRKIMYTTRCRSFGNFCFGNLFKRNAAHVFQYSIFLVHLPVYMVAHPNCKCITSPTITGDCIIILNILIIGVITHLGHKDASLLGPFWQQHQFLSPPAANAGDASVAWEYLPEASLERS